MRANQRARSQALQHRDGGQFLLLSGFLLAGAVLVAMGTYSVLQRTQTQVASSQASEMLELFLNTRDRTIAFFGLVSPYDTASSVDTQLDGYLQSQYRTARVLGMDLQAQLASATSDAPDGRQEDNLVDRDDPGTYDGITSYDGAEDYSCVADDGTHDGLITNGDGEVLAAIVWVRVLSERGSMDEALIIDVPSTTAGC